MRCRPPNSDRMPSASITIHRSTKGIFADDAVQGSGFNDYGRAPALHKLLIHPYVLTIAKLAGFQYKDDIEALMHQTCTPKMKDFLATIKSNRPNAGAKLLPARAPSQSDQCEYCLFPK